MLPCANHPERSGAARCARCASPLCDPCGVYLINNDVWCEPCGHGEVESGKGKIWLALLVFFVLLAGWGGLMYCNIVYRNRMSVGLVASVVAPFIVAWRLAHPPTTGDKPIIVRRTPAGPPIPVSKRLR